MDLTPRGILTHLYLNRPIYARTSSYGHFGRTPDNEGGFSWEKTDLADVLRASGEAPARAGSRLGLGTRGALVVGQVALSIVLLIGATLLESLAHLRHVNPGFEPANLLTMQIPLSPSRYDTDQKKAAFFDELVRRVESVPGVRNAAVTLTLPMTGFARTPVQLADQPPAKLNERRLGIIQFITPAYFRTLKIPLRRGREFTSRDILGAALVAIINESLARRFWPAYPNGQDPVGQRILIGASPQPVEIVGIVADLRQSLESDPRPGNVSSLLPDPAGFGHVCGSDRR